MISNSGFSYAKEMAGTISQPRSIQRISTVDRGRGTWKMMKKMKGVISGMFDYRV